MPRNVKQLKIYIFASPLYLQYYKVISNGYNFKIEKKIAGPYQA